MFVHTPRKALDHSDRRLPNMSDVTLHRPSGYCAVKTVGDKYRAIARLQRREIASERAQGLRT